jgi:predicted permease
MDTLLRDIRYGMRSLRRDKAFAVTVVLTLAVCIAANSATFAIVNSVLLRPLPVPDADQILLMANRYPGAGAADSTMSGSGDYYDRLQAVSAFQEQAMFQLNGRTVEMDGAPQRIEAMSATPSLFRLLQVPPAVGRAFTDEEGEIGAEQKVILSHGLWQQLFAGDPAALGRELRLSGRPYTIVGVMPSGFVFVNPDVRLWTPLAFTAEQKQAHHSNNWYSIGRLKPGTTLGQVQAQVDVLNAANLDRFPDLKEALINAGFHTEVLELKQMLVGNVGPTLYLLWGGALFVLLIGGLNIANLALVRLTLRRRELATRLALGAGRAQITRQFVVENLLVTVAGGAAGIALGAGLLRGLSTFGLERLPRAGEIQMDGAAVLFALGLASAVGILVGCAPLLRSFRVNLSAVLREDERSGAGGRRASRLRQSLVSSQIAFAFVLLVGAGLLLVSFQQLLRVDPGFRTEGVLTASTTAPESSFPELGEVRALMGRSLQAIRQIPSVMAAGASTAIPFGSNRSGSVIFAEGYEMKPGESVVSPRQIIITPGYFEAMGVELVRGRCFDDRDHEKSMLAVIVDERLAQKFWPGQDPIGKRMYQPQQARSLFQTDENTRWKTVVGVVRSVRLDDLVGSGSPFGAYYFPHAQEPWRTFTFAVKTLGDRGESVARTFRSEMARVAPGLALFDVRTMTERADLSLASRRTALMLAVGFGTVALALSAIGIYGVLAYHVTQRRREIGIRVALGSTGAGIVRLVLREGLWLAGAGLLVGIAGAVGLRQVVENEIYGVGALDPLVMGSVVALLAAVVLASSFFPARRAIRVDPMRALNQQ